MGEQYPKETQSFRRGVSSSCLLQPTIRKSSPRNEEFGLTGLWLGSVDTYKSRAENVVLDSLGLAIADAYLVPQASPAPGMQESVLQVVFLSSDPRKSLWRCVSTWEDCFSSSSIASPMPFHWFSIHLSFPFLQYTRGERSDQRSAVFSSTNTCVYLL